jgi:hypothetical protein
LFWALLLQTRALLPPAAPQFVNIRKKRVLIDGEKFQRLLLGSHNKQDAYKVVGTARRLEKS